ncbi:hypothetical protein FSP39_017497 [Pinctada imbricata]|uniref:Zinc finger PHD-type domain-containing protein n=1 Tax=Pinctada imbricata TaxID=66713 RepID=A0AA88XPN7_PINIB|nr:hypothetical protein FSP39_017497 [Pinctada imbricata]
MPREKKRQSRYKKGYAPSPDRIDRTRKALEMVRNNISIQKAASSNYLSYGYLYRRMSGEVEIDSRNGPAPVFNRSEEEAIANWLSEMAKRGMGLTPKKFLEFIQTILNKDKRKNPFKDNLPGYDWYYAFMARNGGIVDIRRETVLEVSRSRLTRQDVDRWYISFRKFLSSKGLIEKPAQIYNADETGFTMGSRAGKVVGPASRSAPVPHVTSSKDRLTAMFCGNADGQMIPPFLIYPGSKPMSSNSLMGALTGTALEYTKSGWMNAETFKKFIIHHLSRHAVSERPIVLLIDSVSSHIDMEVFQLAIENQIELYRIIPNATHLMQPLDKGVFGPLKKAWSQGTREYYRENPGCKINKANFAQKLKDTYMMFYKPLTVINSFKASGIYPVDSSAVSDDDLRPGLTFVINDTCASEIQSSQDCQQDSPENQSTVIESVKAARQAFEAFESVLVTPEKERYRTRIEEQYDVVGCSPRFDTYRKLFEKAQPISIPEGGDSSEISGLDVLADVASSVQAQAGHSQPSGDSGKVISEDLIFPQAPVKEKRQRISNILPDNLTSKECIRTLALKDLEKVREFAEKRRMKAMYEKKRSNERNQGKKRKRKQQKILDEEEEDDDDSDDDRDAICIGCTGTYAEDEMSGLQRTWIPCDSCREWVHEDCTPVEMPEGNSDEFVCHLCI